MGEEESSHYSCELLSADYALVVEEDGVILYCFEGDFLLIDGDIAFHDVADWWYNLQKMARMSCAAM